MSYGNAKQKMVTAAVAAILILFAWWMHRDLALSRDESKAGGPDIAIERITFMREIGGRDWNVEAISAEHRSGMISASSIVVTMDDRSDDRRARMNAASGEFYQDRDEMMLYDAYGSVFFDGRSADISANAASCDSSSGSWSFFEGVTVSLDNASINADYATVDAAGEMILREGVVAEWILDDISK